MKKVINLKEVMLIILSVVMIVLSSNVLATDGLFVEDGNTTKITGNEYDGAQNVPIDDNSTLDKLDSNVFGNSYGSSFGSSLTNSATSSSKTNTSKTNSVKKYNTSNTTDLPKTGIEDYNVGILLIIFVTSAIFAYKKSSDYKNV